jgi:hypothetical protein
MPAVQRFRFALIDFLRLFFQRANRIVIYYGPPTQTPKFSQNHIQAPLEYWMKSMRNCHVRKPPQVKSRYCTPFCVGKAVSFLTARFFQVAFCSRARRRFRASSSFRSLSLMPETRMNTLKSLAMNYDPLR